MRQATRVALRRNLLIDERTIPNVKLVWVQLLPISLHTPSFVETLGYLRRKVLLEPVVIWHSSYNAKVQNELLQWNQHWINVCVHALDDFFDHREFILVR